VLIILTNKLLDCVDVIFFHNDHLL
jgi:hypothetical protein